MSKVKYFDIHSQAINGSVITIVGKVETGTAHHEITEGIPVQLSANSIVGGSLTYQIKHFHRTLTIGLSICNKRDEFNENEGIRIAKKRIEKGNNVGIVETDNVTMLTDDQVIALLFAKLTYFTAHVDKAIKLVNANFFEKVHGDDYIDTLPLKKIDKTDHSFNIDTDAIGI